MGLLFFAVFWFLAFGPEADSITSNVGSHLLFSVHGMFSREVNHPIQPAMVARSYNPSTQEAKAGGSQV
jgi:hypothetical protein